MSNIAVVYYHEKTYRISKLCSFTFLRVEEQIVSSADDPILHPLHKRAFKSYMLIQNRRATPLKRFEKKCWA